MTTMNDSKPSTIIGAQLLQIFAAYEALADLIQSSDSECRLLEVLNQQFRAILDQADQVGMLP